MASIQQTQTFFFVVKLISRNVQPFIPEMRDLKSPSSIRVGYLRTLIGEGAFWEGLESARDGSERSSMPRSDGRRCPAVDHSTLIRNRPPRNNVVWSLCRSACHRSLHEREIDWHPSMRLQAP